MQQHLLTRKILYFFIPSVLMFVIFYLGPVFLTFTYSFTNKTLTGLKSRNYDFVGLDNFIQMFKDPRFLGSIVKTIVFLTFSGIIGQQVLGMLLAIMRRGKSKLFNKIIGTAILLPWVMPEVVAGFSLYAFFGELGTLNAIFEKLMGTRVAWIFVSPMLVIIVANIWRGTAFSMLVFSAAIDGVPREIEESAEIEGCGAWEKIWYIIIPCIKGSIITNSVLVTFQTIGAFGLIFMLTGGGPSGRTQTLPLFMYDQAFVRYQVGYGTAISLILLLIGIAISLVYINLEKKEI